ncbi:hypothetical protein [Sphingomonas sp. SAFR-052]|uniref:hypothetical protein n=1 Tax=Sphingomonas sp. SAFR-052 TaxID=3436867 RepID=UPI003F7D0775
MRRNEYWSVFRGERILALLDRLPAGVKLDVNTAHLTIAGIDPVAFLTAQRERINCIHLTIPRSSMPRRRGRLPIRSFPNTARPRCSAIPAPAMST